MFGAPFAIMRETFMSRFRLKYACFMGSGEFSVHIYCNIEIIAFR